MKKFTLISGIVALMLTTALADFSFSKMYEELKAVAEATDVNVSNIDTDKNVSTNVVIEENNTMEKNSSIKNIFDENITETSTEENK